MLLPPLRLSGAHGRDLDLRRGVEHAQLRIGQMLGEPLRRNEQIRNVFRESGVCVHWGEVHGQPGSSRARGYCRVLSAGIGPRPGQEKIADGRFLRQPAEA